MKWNEIGGKRVIIEMCYRGFSRVVEYLKLWICFLFLFFVLIEYGGIFEIFIFSRRIGLFFNYIVSLSLSLGYIRFFF